MVSTVWGAALLLVLFLAPVLLTFRLPTRGAVCGGIRRGAIRPASPPIPQGRRNSNSFLAHIARQLPELGIDMPSNAVGKDFLPGGGCFAAAPSRSKFQLSLCRLFGILLAAREGLDAVGNPDVIDATVHPRPVRMRDRAVPIGGAG